MELKDKILEHLEFFEKVDKMINCEEPTAAQRDVLAALHDTTDRAVRKAIHELRREGNRIISNPARSGYWLGTPEEWDAFCDRERQAALSRMYRKTNEHNKQIRISVG